MPTIEVHITQLHQKGFFLDLQLSYNACVVYLIQVLQHVRLPLMSPKFLVGTVGAELLIKSDDACRDLVDEAKNYLLLPQERPLMQGPRTRPRKPIRCGEVLFAGVCLFCVYASVFMLNMYVLL